MFKPKVQHYQGLTFLQKFFMVSGVSAFFAMVGITPIIYNIAKAYIVEEVKGEEIIIKENLIDDKYASTTFSSDFEYRSETREDIRHKEILHRLDRIIYYLSK